MDLMQLVPAELPKNLHKKVVHKCHLEDKPDPVRALHPDDNCINYIKRWIMKRCILSRSHPVTQTWIKSNAAIRSQINDHINIYPCMIHPFSEFRTFWEALIIILTLFSLMLIPFVIAFDFYQWIYVIFGINILFLIDILLNFFTGHFESSTREIILDRKDIARKYIRRCFIPDILSAFPVEVLVLYLSDDHDSMKYWTLFNIFTIFRIKNLIVYLRRFRNFHQISFKKYKILEMLIIIFTCIHWAACLEWYIPIITKQLNLLASNESWISSDLLKSRNTTLKKYIAGANRATIALIGGSHHLDVKTIDDILLNLFLTILGRIGIIYILAQFSGLMSTSYSTKKKNVKLLQQLTEYMRYKELPRHIQQRILTYFYFWSNKSVKKDKIITSNLSPNLREEVIMYNCRNLLEKVEFFKHIPPSILPQVVMHLTSEIYLANDVLVKAGTIGDALYYIITGTVGVYTSSERKVCNLEDKSYFGEVSLVMENEKRLTSVIALEPTEVYILKRQDFIKTISVYPNLVSRLQKLTIEKIDKSLLCETLHKSEGSTSININIYND
ncbi:Similar to Hcn1: Potassium/sodium hyperpolarization-activated cyclic nucleotide-gated channel 1 (Rattus norvegicus) [Cotesia congregata]|uniref:Similar to Hcn1: Potassium/sodium hyperpolarization-activated cyclic nucleotide-gated channel 1 (Rattus norvegicus) n=1 Tax=Cotesia congregata TaxID=51543 RepID=A0A8J2MTM1_COTCN|nr:Similar to Hcn1: Potassium/sodium hyperpolarization-activated cyclic nucleotide-gated channel 1 (Rattus norvegicus) [Cotesia congregata]